MFARQSLLESFTVFLTLQRGINLLVLTQPHAHLLTLMKPHDYIYPSHQQHFCLNTPLMCAWWIFFRCFLAAISDQNKCTCTSPPLPPLATAAPPGRVKIDSLASSTRQLCAICSHLGCSSSFCFCDCSSNITVLAMKGGGGIKEGDTQKWGVAWTEINRI